MSAVQDAGPASRERGGVVAEPWAAAAGLDADQLYGRIIEKRGKCADGIRSAADTRDHAIWQTADTVKALAARLLADDPLEGAHDVRIRVRTNGRTEQVVTRLDGSYPIAEGLADGVLERACAGGDRADLCAEQPHAIHIHRLALGVFFAHIHHALQAEHGAHRCSRHAMLTCAGFSDDASLAHPLRQKALADGVVDLVRAGVREVLAFEPHLA